MGQNREGIYTWTALRRRFSVNLFSSTRALRHSPVPTGEPLLPVPSDPRSAGNLQNFGTSPAPTRRSKQEDFPTRSAPRGPMDGPLGAKTAFFCSYPAIFWTSRRTRGVSRRNGMARVGQDLAPQPRITRLGCCERSPSGALRAPDGVLAARKSGSCPGGMRPWRPGRKRGAGVPGERTNENFV